MVAMQCGELAVAEIDVATGDHRTARRAAGAGPAPAAVRLGGDEPRPPEPGPPAARGGSAPGWSPARSCWRRRWRSGWPGATTTPPRWPRPAPGPAARSSSTRSTCTRCPTSGSARWPRPGSATGTGSSPHLDEADALLDALGQSAAVGDHAALVPDARGRRGRGRGRARGAGRPPRWPRAGRYRPLPRRAGGGGRVVERRAAPARSTRTRCRPRPAGCTASGSSGRPPTWPGRPGSGPPTAATCWRCRPAPGRWPEPTERPRCRIRRSAGR